MVVSQSVVITVVPPCLAHIVGGITIPLSFAMCGRVVAQRNVGELMVADADNMRITFIKCNNAYFDGKLPLPNFGLVHSYDTCAYFHYSYDRWFGSKFYDPIIQFTDYYDFTEKMFVDLMCHEMIHYYLAYYGIDRKVKHGKEFNEMADRLNKKYRLHITEDYDRSTLKRSADAPLLKYWLSNLF